MSGWWDEQLAGAGAATALPVHWAPPVVAPATADPQDWWGYARRCARLYRDGVNPPAVRVHGPVLDRDEDALVVAEGVGYSRLYGGDGTYTPANTWVVGRPAVMATAAVLTAAVNHRRKSAARREAAVRWRDHQQVVTIATTWRLMCNPGGRFISFYYEAITEFHPDLHDWSMTLAFGDQCGPLHLRGLAVPTLALWVAAAVYGPDWADDPRLGLLLA